MARSYHSTISVFHQIKNTLALRSLTSIGSGFADNTLKIVAGISVVVSSRIHIVSREAQFDPGQGLDSA